MENIPSIITSLLKRSGLNHAERIDIPDREVYVLSSIAADGTIVPIGLPCLFEITEEGLQEIDVNESFEILEKYG